MLIQIFLVKYAKCPVWMNTLKTMYLDIHIRRLLFIYLRLCARQSAIMPLTGLCMGNKCGASCQRKALLASLLITLLYLLMYFGLIVIGKMHSLQIICMQKGISNPVFTYVCMGMQSYRRYLWKNINPITHKTACKSTYFECLST